MKKVYLFVTFNAMCLGLMSQTFQWAKAEGKYAYDYGYGIATDNQGNLYVAGKYEENGAVFSSTTVPCAGNHDGFLTKYAPNGDLIWIRTMGGTLGDYAQAMHCDKSNYVYISGEMEGYNNLISFPGSTVTLNCVGDNDLFLAKYDLNGNLIWAKGEGGINSEKALGITSDMNDNVYICGYYTNTTTINGTAITGKTGRNIYVAKYDKDGVFQWFKDAGSDGRDEAKAVKCDAAGNVYICGMFSNNCEFPGNTLTTYNNTNYWDAFLAKYDPSGNLLWVKTGGGDIDDGAWSLAIDNGGSIYIGGECGAYVSFSGENPPSVGEADSYVAKYNSGGNLQWIKRVGSDKVDRVRGIGTDGTHIFITGQFGGTAYFGGAPAITAGDTSDIYIAALDSDGSFKWAVAVAGPTDAFENLGYESGNGVTGFAAGQDGSVYATGGLLDGGVFGGTTITKAGSRTDAFVTKVSWDTGMPPLPTAVSALSMDYGIAVYPNPGNGHFRISNGNLNAPVKVCVYNCVGQLVQSVEKNASDINEINLEGKQEGIYFLEINKGEQVVYRQKLILQN